MVHIHTQKIMNVANNYKDINTLQTIFPGTHYKYFVSFENSTDICVINDKICVSWYINGISIVRHLKYLMKTFSTYSQRHWLMEIGVPDGLHISMHVFIMKHFILAVIRAIKPFCDNIWYRKMQTPWRLPKSIFFYLIEVKYSKCLHIWIIRIFSWLLQIPIINMNYI